MPDILLNKFETLVRKYGIDGKIDIVDMFDEFQEFFRFRKDFIHREMFNKGLQTILIKMLKAVKLSNNNDITRAQLKLDHSEYNSLAKLRYWGLIAHVTNSQGKKLQGHWLLTAKAGKFLRGEIRIPIWVDIKRNTKINESAETVSIGDYDYGTSPCWTTRQEYVDDYNGRLEAQPNLFTNIKN